MKIIRIVLSLVAAVVVYFINGMLTTTGGLLSGEAALLQMTNSDAAAIASKAGVQTAGNLSLLAVALFVVLMALIWLLPLGKKGNNSK